MSESKSLLMPFIIVAVLIFGGAVAWKMMGNKETEITDADSLFNLPKGGGDEEETT